MILDLTPALRALARKPLRNRKGFLGKCAGPPRGGKDDDPVGPEAAILVGHEEVQARVQEGDSVALKDPLLYIR